MDYKEKYEQALERARDNYKANQKIGKLEENEVLSDIFPELEESEDEKVRKTLIRFFKDSYPNETEMYDGSVTVGKAIIWLENQKPIELNQYNDSIRKELLKHLKEGAEGYEPAGSSEDYARWLAWLEKQKPIELNQDDEKIRKAILNYFTKCWENCKDDVCGIHVEDAIAWLEMQVEPQDKGEISDGYHTFNELYNYRMLYNAGFFNLLPKEWVHKSKKHHNGEECFGGGWFIVMANLPTGQISNHYELKDWDLFHIQEKEVADEWDGHTPQEAAERLHKFLLEKQNEEKSVNWNVLTWEDINDLESIMNEVHSDFRHGIGQKSFGLEVLERFLYNKDCEDLDIKSPKFKDGDEIRSIDGQYEDTVLEVLSDGSYRLKNLGLLSIAENEWELANAPVDGYELIEK